MPPSPDASPPPASEPPPARSRFWFRWGTATVVLGVLTVYGAFLEGGPSPIQDATEPTPEDHAAPDASATPHAPFEAIVYAGSGSGRLELQVPGDQPAIMNLRHDGAMDFAVEARDDAGDTDLVVDATGGYEGTRTVNLGEVLESYRELDIQADGDWTIEVLPLSAARRVEDGAAAGRGDDVVLIERGGRGWFGHDGRAEVVVQEYRGPERFAGLVILDEVGPYDGKVHIAEDTEVLAITADGAWELSID